MHTVDVTVTKFINPIIDWVNDTLPKLPGFIIGLLIGILAVRIASRMFKSLLSLTNITPALRGVISSAIESLLWALLAIWLLQLLGFKEIIVFFSSSVFAIGLLLSAGGSTLLSDLVAGIFLAQDGDFDIGDEVIVGETPTRGTVESMDARRVRIRDKDGVLHILPNSIVERKEWVLVKKRESVGALLRAVKTAKKLREVALEHRNTTVRNNNQ